jgi:hypothetical protein
MPEFIIPELKQCRKKAIILIRRWLSCHYSVQRISCVQDSMQIILPAPILSTVLRGINIHHILPGQRKHFGMVNVSFIILHVTRRMLNDSFMQI